MGFQLVEPKARYTPDVPQARISRSDKPRSRGIVIGLNSKLFEEIGEPDYVDVFIGDGEDRGIIQIQPTDDDTATLVRSIKGGGAIYLYSVDLIKFAKRTVVEHAWDKKEKALNITVPASLLA